LYRRAAACVSIAGLLAVFVPLGSGAPQADQAHVAHTASTAACPWLNQSLPISKRVDLLLARMNLTDEIAEMYVDPGTKVGPYAGYGGAVPAQPALCIPALVEQDDSVGVGDGATDVTQLPAEVSLGSAWSPSLARQYGALNGLEHWEKGIAMALGPGVNIQRDPRWGRNFEMFSEDPFLTASLGAADIEGLQSEHALADVKHFVTYNQETNRNTPADNVILSARALHEIYLPPFYSAVKQADAASVMCSYASMAGQYSCQDPSQLTGVLDDRWGFQGFVRSDSGANHSTSASANAGLDQERGLDYWHDGQLAAAVADGQVKRSTINEAVHRILTEMFQFDLFNDPPTGTLASPVNTPDDDAFARTVAEQGTVLLQNNGPILPLSTATTKSIAVIGADGTTNPLTAGGGSAHVTPPYVVSPLTGITSRAGSGVTVTSYSGADPSAAAATAGAAQVAIVFANFVEGEGTDLKSISLPNDQDALIESVAAANPNTIVVLNSGGPVLMPWLHQVKGVLEGWYAGQEDGNAIAAILFGDVDPGGHLTETFPTSLSAMPTASPSRFPGVGGKVRYSEGLDVGYRWYDARHVTPLFPFGYGLSYTSFRFSNLTVGPKSVANLASGPDSSAGQGAALVRVSATITNTGPVTGSDVVQLYLGDPVSAAEPPRQLKGFQRVTLQPGASRIVNFKISGHDLSYFNATANGWTLPDGRYYVYVGGSSALTSLPLRATFTVSRTIGTRYAQLSSAANATAGVTFTATAQFVNHGDVPIFNGTVHLRAPAGWTVVRDSPRATLSIPAGQSATRYFSVTAPEKAQGNTGTLNATLSSAGVHGAGDLNASTTVQVEPGLTLTPVTTAAAAPGQSVPVTVKIASDLDHAVTVRLAPTPPLGITTTPHSPTIRVRGHRTVTLSVLLTVQPGVPPGAHYLSLRPSFTDHGTRYGLYRAAIPISVAYPSLAAAYDTIGISDDTDVSGADFDNVGDSFSEQALSAVALAPGAAVTVGAATLQWPDVAAGTPDSVLAEGQTISLAGTPSDTQLDVLGASSTTGASGTGTIQYTDGTVQSYALTLDDWFGAASGRNATIATTPYINDSTGRGNGGEAGQRAHAASLFGVSIPLAPGKTVSSVTLPTVSPSAGTYTMHVFALGLG
jgi:beta-glucosidase